jgi:asparagine synthase (glutamine-hydrolysing)
MPGAEAAVDKALRIDQLIMLVDDPVKRVDNMTMAWGLEARVPFLDHELVELAARIPAEHKLCDDGKCVLKAVGRRVIPSSVIDRPKGYFPVPALKYPRGEVLDMMRDAVHVPARPRPPAVPADYVDELLADPESTSRRCAAPSSGRWRCWSCGCRSRGSESADRGLTLRPNQAGPCTPEQ